MESTLIQEKKPSKEEVFESLEKDINLLNEMFTDLHDIVKQHGEQLDTLEDSIIATKSDVELAHKDIVSAKSFSSSFNSIRTGVVGAGLGALFYLYNPHIAIGTIIIGGYLGWTFSEKIQSTQVEKLN
jgi:hypothetical protein